MSATREGSLEASQQTRTDLELQVAALLELSARSAAFPLYFYEPATPAANSFHRSKARLRILSGGNRSGKSHTGGAEIAAAALGYRPWVLREMGIPAPLEPWKRPADCPPEALVYNGAGVRITVPSDIFVVSGLPAKKGIGEVMHPKLKTLLGSLVEREWMAHAGTPSKIQLKNGTTIHYGSAEQDLPAFEGTNYAYISIDEPIPRRVYTALRRGAIDQFANISMTFTPIGRNSAWLFHDLYGEKDKSKIENFQCSIFDNRFLPPEAVKEFENDPTLSELEKEARLHGKFMHLADRIYHQFREDTHVVDPFKVPADWICGMVVDPHTVRPWAIAYFCINQRGDIIFYKEWPETDFTRIRRDGRGPAEYATLIRQLDSDSNITMRLGDPNYSYRTDLTRGVFIPSVASDLARYNIVLDCEINDDLDYGEAKVRQLLSYDDKRPLSSLNRPRMYFSSDCRNLINSMLYYSFRVKPQGEDPDESKREERFKDFADCVRYVAVRLADAGWAAADHYQTPNDPIEAYGESW